MDHPRVDPAWCRQTAMMLVNDAVPDLPKARLEAMTAALAETLRVAIEDWFIDQAPAPKTPSADEPPLPF